MCKWTRETETARETGRHRERERAERNTGLEVLGKEVRAGIKTLKNNKSEEKDHWPIPSQKPRCLEEAAMTGLITICQDIIYNESTAGGYPAIFHGANRGKLNATTCL